MAEELELGELCSHKHCWEANWLMGATHAWFVPYSRTVSVGKRMHGIIMSMRMYGQS